MTSELDALPDAVRTAVPADEGIAEAVTRAATEWRRPTRVHVAGRAGVGRSTVITALGLTADAETAPLDVPHAPTAPPDADLVVYVLAAGVHPADVQALSDRDPARTLVLLNKADAVSQQAARVTETVDEIAKTLGMPVFPLIATLGIRTTAAEISESELRSLVQLARIPDATLTLSAEVLLGAHVPVDVRVRRTMLEKWDLAGIAFAVRDLREGKVADAASVTAMLRAASGIDAAVAALAQRRATVDALRGGTLLDTLARIAARSIPENGGLARDRIEHFLRADQAIALGLSAGLACADVADVAARWPNPRPVDAADALRRADLWRRTGLSDSVAPSGRRAALRIYAGYMRIWEGLTGV